MNDDEHDEIMALRAAQTTYEQDETEAGGIREQAIRNAYAAGVPRRAIAAIVGDVLVEEVLGPA